jgi:hypothetical protein
MSHHIFKISDLHRETILEFFDLYFKHIEHPDRRLGRTFCEDTCWSVEQVKNELKDFLNGKEENIKNQYKKYFKELEGIWKICVEKLDELQE